MGIGKRKKVGVGSEKIKRYDSEGDEEEMGRKREEKRNRERARREESGEQRGS